MRAARVFPLLAVFAVLAASVAHAQAPAPITSDELDRFIRDWPEVIAWANQRNEQLGSVKDRPSLLGAYAASADLLGLLQSRGWQPERFFEVAGQTSSALYRIDLEDQMPDVIQQIEEQKKAIEGNPGLTVQQKGELLAQMDALLQQMGGLTDTLPVTDAEVQLVRQRRGDIETLFE
jgi:hypothetical protein